MTGTLNFGESKFNDYKSLLSKIVHHYRRMEFIAGDASASDIRNIIGDSLHPEDLGFLLYIDFNRYLGERNYDSAFASLSEAEKHFQKLNSSVRNTLVLHDRALAYFRMYNYEEANKYFMKTLEAMDDEVEEKNKCSIFNNIGECYLYLRYYNLALEYCFKAMKIREEKGYQGLGSSYYNMMVIHIELQEYCKSIEYGLRALKIFRENQDENSTANALNSIGIAHSSLGEFDTALQYFQDSLAIRKARSENSRIAMVLHGMGNMAMKSRVFDKAKLWHEQALKMRRESGDAEYIASSLVSLGKLNIEMGNPQKALVYLLETEEYRIQRPEIQSESHMQLARAYELQGDYDKSYQYLKLHLEEIRKIWDQEKSINLAEMKIKIELDRKEQELAYSQQKNQELEEKNKLIESQKVSLEETLANLRKSELSLSFIKKEMSHQTGYSRIIGESEAMRSIIDLMRKVASSDDTSVLITGESGTGKELVARGIHEMSTRRDHYFNAINASAISGTLFESELFGHEKGAFTGADTLKPGWFEVANGGTLFLDEIGNMPIDQQIKLLRALDKGNIIRVGARREISVNVRVISATNMNLHEMIDEKTFREDLYHRLAVFVIHIPPLRERPEDIPLLVEYFVRNFSQKLKKTILRIDPGVFSQITAYHFPGNVRELSNMVEKAIIISDSTCLQVKHFSFSEKKNHSSHTQVDDCGTLEEVEKSMLIKALLNSGFNQTKAAKLLGISPKAVERRIAKFHISKDDYLIKT